MADVFPLTSARAHLGELVKRARYGRERLVITEHGKPVAAIVSVDELAELQAAVDAADAALAARARASGEAGIPHEQVMAAMDALDAADDTGSAEAAAILAPYAELLRRADAAPES
jgi:prevent-host-death family protein